MFLAPLAGLLLVTGPVTAREWRWLIGTGAASLFWLVMSGGIADQVANATAVVMTGAFVASSIAEGRPVFTRACWAVLIASVCVALWCAVWGIAWQDLELALTRQWWAVSRDLSIVAGPVVNQSTETRQFFERLADAGRPLAQLFPARLIVSGILGLVVAASWHQRITGRSLGPAAERLGDFRFTDHLVWVVILAVAVLLLPSFHLVQDLADQSPVGGMLLFTVEYWGPAAQNTLVVCGALYAARGAAVLSRFLRPVPAMILVVIATIFLLPFAFIGLAAVGLADTWANFRRWLDVASTLGR